MVVPRGERLGRAANRAAVQISPTAKSGELSFDRSLIRVISAQATATITFIPTGLFIHRPSTWAKTQQMATRARSSPEPPTAAISITAHHQVGIRRVPIALRHARRTILVAGIAKCSALRQ